MPRRSARRSSPSSRREASTRRLGKVSLPFLVACSESPVTVVRSRRLLALAALIAAVVVAVLASIAVGTRSIGPGEVWRALAEGGPAESTAIVRQLRLPRTAL